MDNDIISIRFIKDEDFVNYRKPSMFIGTARCDFKCCTMTMRNSVKSIKTHVAIFGTLLQEILQERF